MLRSSKLPPINNLSLEKADNRSVELEVPRIPKEERGIQFFNGKFTIRTANRLELREKAYKLLYNIYSEMGIIRNNHSGLWLSIFDALPETTTIIAEDTKGEILGTLTLVFESPIGLPADELYKEKIDEFRAEGRKISEIISFGINETARSSVKILASLIYSGYLLALRVKNSTDLLVTVSKQYENFYCRSLLFNKVGPVRKYSKVNGRPTVLLNLPLDLPGKLQNERRIFPLYLLKYSEREELRVAKAIHNMHRPMSDEEFYVFFIEKSNVWEKSSAEQRDYIKSLYPASQ
ncbi:MAG: hypothetical protein KJO34_11635, partial [Deltaproteobacteria bacterium]|nr:hypothetical protein [Deltaproteobacteria bacterium]